MHANTCLLAGWLSTCSSKAAAACKNIWSQSNCAEWMVHWGANKVSKLSWIWRASRWNVKSDRHLIYHEVLQVATTLALLTLRTICVGNGSACCKLNKKGDYASDWTGIAFSLRKGPKMWPCLPRRPSCSCGPHLSRFVIENDWLLDLHPAFLLSIYPSQLSNRLSGI